MPDIPQWITEAVDEASFRVIGMGENVRFAVASIIAQHAPQPAQPGIEVLNIPPTPELDRVYVYWHNVEPNKGYVTITCYGSAWTAWFGAMPTDTIQQFFQRADTGYLVNALVRTQWLKQNAGHTKYLKRIVTAIKDAMKEANNG